MKPTKFTYLALTLVFLIGGFFFLLKSNQAQQTAQVKKSNNTTIEHSKYEGVDIKSAISDEETFHSAIHYPIFQEEALNKKIEKSISKIHNNFREEVSIESKKHLKENPATLLVSFDIYEAADDVYSIVFSEESYVNGANGRAKTKIFLVDTKEGKFIKQHEIFTDDRKAGEKLYLLLNQQFKSSKDYRDYYFEDQLKERIKDNSNLENMYLTDKSMNYKFGKYEVTAGAAGMPEISIPLSKVQDLLAPQWKKRLKLQDNIKEDQSNPEAQNKKNENNKLSAQQEPTAPAPQSGKQVALTFDDGPHPQNTPAILNLLKKYDAKATFFMLGSRVDFYPDVAKQVAEQGHELGNHTWDHKDLTTLPAFEVQDEIKKTDYAIKKATGIPSSAYRPPYGAFNDQVKNSAGGTPVLWSVDTLDWKSKNPNEVLSIVKSNVGDNSIILMHDIHATTVEALDKVLQYLKSEGYHFVTVSEIQA
ncbi:polysaccharide deacetylase family protein [Mesobacillus zeae]|uniref:DUF3298 domain-containing protein n=1 Tax=Mesobacillus zeae TaxID=1917180 RepID=A0A398BDK9_9BACI|nr:polysaccharide deacetylase family protein [Mesobacillus zeae]RID88349.1 DUF3298 domain-containing protein [Mesobacillus zeae]